MKTVTVVVCLAVLALGRTQEEEAKRQEYMERFNAFDTDGNGKVTFEDFDTMFKHLDTDDNNLVEMTEYLHQTKQKAEEAVMFFQEVDRNKDHYINVEENRALFDLIDINADGVISVEEFTIFHEATVERMKAAQG